MQRGRLLNALGWVSFALACSAFLLPIVNPDIYWHLAAGKYALAHLAPPRRDVFSWTMAGRRWTDFEWLSQAVYYLLWLAGGWRALQLFKALLLALTLLVFRRTVLLHGRRAALPLLLPFFALGILSNCDLRPENFTLLFFAATFYFLEKRRLAGEDLKGPGAAAAFAFFALWANLHAGFLYGLALAGIYAAGEFAEALLPYLRGRAPFRRPPAAADYLKVFAAGLAASFATPYGWRVYSVVLNHARYSAALSAHIREWAPFSPGDPYQWPYALALAGALGAVLFFALRRRRVVWHHAGTLLLFGWLSLSYGRNIPFFMITAPVCALALPWASPGPRARRALAWAAVPAAALLLWFWAVFALPQYSSAPRLDKWGSPGLASFLRSEKKELSGLRLYNPWGWGGWLEWKLWPDYRTFMDGRYLFHGRIEEMAGLDVSAANWRRLTERYGFGLMLLKAGWPEVPVRQRLPDGSERVFRRPAYLFYLPAADWAVVYWDRGSAALVRRSAVRPDWLKAHELRYLRPGDLPSLEAPALAGALPLSGLRRELGVFERSHPGDAALNSELAGFVGGLEKLCSRKGAKCAE